MRGDGLRGVHGRPGGPPGLAAALAGGRGGAGLTEPEGAARCRPLHLVNLNNAHGGAAQKVTFNTRGPSAPRPPGPRRGPPSPRPRASGGTARPTACSRRSGSAPPPTSSSRRTPYPRLYTMQPPLRPVRPVQLFAAVPICESEKSSVAGRFRKAFYLPRSFFSKVG